MASGPPVGGDNGAREKPKYAENKVYIRKVFKGSRKNPLKTVSVANPPSTVFTAASEPSSAPPSVSFPNSGLSPDRVATPPVTSPAATSPTATTTLDSPDPTLAVATEPTLAISSESTPTAAPEPTPPTVSEPAPAVEPDSAPASTPTVVPEPTSQPVPPITTEATPAVVLEGLSVTPAVVLEAPSVTPAVVLGAPSDSTPAVVLEAPSDSTPDAAALDVEITDTYENNVNNRSSPEQAVFETIVLSEDGDSLHRQPETSHPDVARDDCSLNQQESAVPSVSILPLGSSAVQQDGPSNKVKINLASSSRQEVRELRRKLQGELDVVRTWVKRIEEKEGLVSGFSQPQVLENVAVDNGVQRIQPEVVPISIPSRENRPLNQLSISVLENSLGVTESLEKEKRTPKANPFYRNSEFLLAKDKFPPAESNKKSKVNGKKKGSDMRSGHGVTSRFFKNCGSLLDRLMKHTYGWVFNNPVDVKGLGLHDYYTIIKYPMDLGTVKERLTSNSYRIPKQFADDVRLTFHNAMTYNPKGQDVHYMAATLLKIFEEKWAIIESDYNHECRFALEYEISVPTPTSRKAPPPFVPSSLDLRRVLDRSDSIVHAADYRPKPVSITPTGRTPAPKKPKAKDLNKRGMTFDEKQKLSTNLQNLPSDKLDNIVQIIKKRNSSLRQHDDEIEVDIDSVDTETLWELDRFVTNYKKSLSKHKRKAELALQRAQAPQASADKDPRTAVVEVPQETHTAQNVVSSSPVQDENHGVNSSRSSSSSSSSSDSGSSSSDSDSDSSSSSDTDAGHSPRT